MNQYVTKSDIIQKYENCQECVCEQLSIVEESYEWDAWGPQVDKDDF